MDIEGVASNTADWSRVVCAHRVVKRIAVGDWSNRLWVELNQSSSAGESGGTAWWLDDGQSRLLASRTSPTKKARY